VLYFVHWPPALALPPQQVLPLNWEILVWMMVPQEAAPESLVAEMRVVRLEQVVVQIVGQEHWEWFQD
jgi:hypothetical protein